MRYMGSKKRVAKEILSMVLTHRKENQWYVEPFMGSCAVIQHVSGKRIANDYNNYLVACYKSVVNNGWEPPDTFSEETYKHMRNHKDDYPPELVGFIGFGCAFGGDFFAGFAKDTEGTNYCLRSKNSILKQKHSLIGCDFSNKSYDELEIPDNSIIYCDPPYNNTTGYNKELFDSDKFYTWCRTMVKKNHLVYVSEYSMPDDFICIWEKELVFNLDANRETKTRVEKLFVHKDQYDMLRPHTLEDFF